MKKILRIARVELSILFYSPIAWLILIIFIIQCGITITDILETHEAKQELGNQLKSLTQNIYGGYNAFFNSVKNKLYLYIPLLTMGLMSRELSSGSIKLLASSPITNKQIILGKFLAAATYCFLLVLVLLGVVLVGYISIEAIDLKYLIGAVLGLYLLACAYAAIGLFMSSLTTYQVVAAISTLAIFAALNFMSSVGQSVEFVRDITYWMTISNRVDNFIAGLISSKDVIYFILIIVLFLTLSVMRLNSGRSTYSITNKLLKYTAVVIGVLFIGYLSSLPTLNGYYDTTRFKTNTLTKSTQSLLKQLDKPVKITVYSNVVNFFGHLGAPKFRIFDLKQFDEYTRFLPNLEIDYVPYYNYTLDDRDNTGKPLIERARRYATAHGYDFNEVLAPNEIEKIIDLSKELNGFVRVVEYDGKQAVLRMFFDQVGYPKESEISAAIKNILYEACKIGVLKGNDERSIDKKGDKDYKSVLNELNLRSSLINQGFDVSSILIKDIDEFPINNSLLVISDPFKPYNGNQLEKIKTYINKGGNVLIAGEPNKEELLNPILTNLGIKYKKGILLQESVNYNLDLIQAKLTSNTLISDLKIDKESVISMPSAMAIEFKDTLGFKIEPILKTDKDLVWNYSGNPNIETDSVAFNHKTDTKESAVVGLALSRDINGINQKIMVFGDADFMSNKEIKRSNLKNQENQQFVTKVFKWFSDNQYPIDTSRPEPIDNKILVSQKQIVWIKIVFTGFLPFLLAVLGGYTLIKRRRN